MVAQQADTSLLANDLIDGSDRRDRTNLPIRTQLLLIALECWSAACAICLLVATCALWIPSANREIPPIPLITACVALGPAWDVMALLSLTLGLFGLSSCSVWTLSLCLIRSKGEELPKYAVAAHATVLRTHLLALRPSNLYTVRRVSLWLILAGGMTLVLLDQLRLQAWFFQLLLFCLVFLLPTPELRLKWLQMMVISIYAYSAIGKLDYQFLNTVGQDFLQAMVQTFGMDCQNWNGTVRVLLASGFPICELMLVAGLCFVRFRRPTGWAACLFHLTLLWLLGGQLGHSWGVLIWNLQFAVQALLLFALPTARPGNLCFVFSTIGKQSLATDLTLAEQRVRWFAPNFLIQACLVLAIVLPATERLGWWDHWPSWALYAPHSSRVQVWVAPHVVESLPSALRQIIEQSTKDQPENQVNTGIEIPLATWSLQVLGVPVYPQARYQLGLSRHLSTIIHDQYAIRAELRSVAGRLEGGRTIQELFNADQIHSASAQFWLNSQPRSFRSKSNSP